MTVKVNDSDHKGLMQKIYSTNLLREPLIHNLIAKLLSLHLFAVRVAAGAGHLYSVTF